MQLTVASGPGLVPTRWWVGARSWPIDGQSWVFGRLGVSGEPMATESRLVGGAVFTRSWLLGLGGPRIGTDWLVDRAKSWSLIS